MNILTSFDDFQVFLWQLGPTFIKGDVLLPNIKGISVQRREYL